nr:MAG: hypothetical protein EU539_03025 [Candidatus Lokiarchaeota archaeon]
MLHKLKEHGFIIWKPRSSIRLSKKGKDIAQQITKNYKKLRQFFAGILKIDDKELIDSLSCGIEHHMTPEVVEALDNLLA